MTVAYRIRLGQPRTWDLVGRTLALAHGLPGGHYVGPDLRLGRWPG